MSKQTISESNRLAMLDAFVLSSVLTILLTRAYLAITGYPQIGGTSLHIAHMLYGGAILVTAFLFLLLAKKPNKHIISSVGGIGFGLFLDEIGKFVTKNNDYFFKPSFGLMYISFLAIWFFARLAIIKADNLPFLSPAKWPTQKFAKLCIVLWTIVQIVVGTAISMTMIFKNAETTTWDIVTPKIAAFATLVFCIYLLYGLLQIRLSDKDVSARTIRTATIIGTLLVYPFYFFATPFIAGIFVAPTILVLIGLSEVSIEDLLRRLFAKPIL